jgi:hypothetical protein
VHHLLAQCRIDFLLNSRAIIMASEAHLRGIARFLIGFGTEEDSDWRDYNLDFCGCIKYGPDGVPILIKPVDDSGYSLGALQLDFGQIQGAVEPFISAFETWQKVSANVWSYPLGGDVAPARWSRTSGDGD